MTKQAVHFSLFHKTVLSVALGIFALFICAPLVPAQNYEAIPLGVYGEWADIASDNNNNLHLIWIRYGTMYYGRIVNNAVTGQQTVPGTTNLVIVNWSWPHIAVSPSGATVHVCWVAPDHKNLFHSWRNSSGGWTTETVASASYTRFFWPICAIDANETVHALSGENSGDGNSKVYYRQKPAGGSWSTATDISYGDAHLNVHDYNSADFSEFDMFTDKNGGIHACWSLINTRYLRYRYCLNGGSLAGSPTEYIADYGATSVGFGNLHVEKSGTVQMAFNGYNGNVNVEHSYKPVGAGWTAPTRPSNGPVGSTAYEIIPAVAVPRDGTGRVMVVWAEGGNVVKMAAWENQAWTHYILDSAASMADAHIKPAMTATDSGVYGVWRTGAAYNNSWVLGVVNTASVVPFSLTAPNGGENLSLAQTFNITWNAADITGDVKLGLFKGGVHLGNITDNISASVQSYTWWVGLPLLNGATYGIGSDYRIQVQSKADWTKKDQSDADFAISGNPALVVAAPNGGENWALASTQSIRWNGYGLTGNVKLGLFKGGVHQGNIAVGVAAGQGSYSWQVGLPLLNGASYTVGSDYKIQVQSEADWTKKDQSDGNFTISGSPAVTVIAPNGGESWAMASTQAITWSAVGLTGNVKIGLFKGGVHLGNIADDVPAGLGSYNWHVGDTLLNGVTYAAGSDYRIQVQSKVDWTKKDQSNGDFALTGTIVR